MYLLRGVAGPFGLAFVLMPLVFALLGATVALYADG
jgi:hypothetical protein